MKRASLAFLLLTMAIGARAEGMDEPAPAPGLDVAEPSLSILARFRPEAAGQAGVDGCDDRILDLLPDYEARNRQALREAIGVYRTRMEAERDPDTRIDLEILVKSAEADMLGSLLREKHELPYFNLGRSTHAGIGYLLNYQIPANRWPSALTRLRRYAGMEPGFTPIAKLAEQRTRERLGEIGLVGPPRAEVERDLANADVFLDGIAYHFKACRIAGYEEPLARLRSQLAAYKKFVREEVLPRSRVDVRFPPEIYAFALKRNGVDMPPDELAAKARSAFEATRKEMQAIADRVARARGWPATDYRAVIRALKREQLDDKRILPHYRKRIGEIEEIVIREGLATLPGRPLRLRLANAASSAAMPAPHMSPPRLIGNTGEQGEFVLPLRVPLPPGPGSGHGPAATGKLDDFTFPAASWTMAAHEGRPGHEMQVAFLIEKRISIARAVFGSTSAYAEGWAVYAETIVFPFMPPEGQLISLQLRLLREARAFLDPDLQAGRTTRAEALRLLTVDAVFSEAFANQEVDRYTFGMPGQAPSYYYGYLQFREMRREAELRAGANFNARRYHDFLMAKGPLPLPLLREAAREEFGRVGAR